MSIAKMLAAEPIEMEITSASPRHEDTELDGMGDDDDDFYGEGEEAAVSEILDAFHSKDPKALRVALKSFIDLCRD